LLISHLSPIPARLLRSIARKTRKQQRFSSLVTLTRLLFCVILPLVRALQVPDVFEGFMASMAEGQLAFENSTGDFHLLEEKIYRTIELLKAARVQKAAAEQELATVRDLLDAQAAETEAVRGQLQALQQERAEVRSRVEKLLGDVDAILDQQIG